MITLLLVPTLFNDDDDDDLASSNTNSKDEKTASTFFGISFNKSIAKPKFDQIKVSSASKIFINLPFANETPLLIALAQLPFSFLKYVMQSRYLFSHGFTTLKIFSVEPSSTKMTSISLCQLKSIDFSALGNVLEAL
jgi:hypothetical protein